MSDRITIDDVRKAGYCASGARRWFRSYGLDFVAFLREGISREEFLATGDHLAEDVVAKKHARDLADG